MATTTLGRLAAVVVPEITLRHRGPDDFELTSRGFHWVSEYPHNR